MDQFNARMNAQRRVLTAVNNRPDWREELCGLSSKAINRWIRANQLREDDKIPILLVKISQTLFFLAVMSQDQVSDEFGNIAAEVASLTDDLETALV